MGKGVQGFRALADVTFSPGPFQVLIGENDSGKTSVLEAVAMLQRLARDPADVAFTGRFMFDRNLRLGSSGRMGFGADLSDGSRWSATFSARSPAPAEGPLFRVEGETARTGSAVLYDRGWREIVVTENDVAGRLHGAQLSDGLVLLLGLLAIVHSTQPSLLLLDEPATGLHVMRSKFLVNLLRGLSRGDFGPKVQVLMTTHSPDIVDYLDPEEVTVVDRDATGAVTLHPLREVDGLKRRLRGYHLGEYWGNYGERGLITGDEN